MEGVEDPEDAVGVATTEPCRRCWVDVGVIGGTGTERDREELVEDGAREAGRERSGLGGV